MATAAVRTLPLRVAPVAGEAIDSWLEATAHRCNVTWADLRAALGPVLPATGYPDQWIGRLTDEQCNVISTATGVDPAALRSMTLEGYPPIAAGFDPQTGQPASSYPWRHTHASRFCPFCLAENGGRWKLVWRTVWFFACPTHHCLLADSCPVCGAAQRSRSLAAVVPQPGRCSASADPQPSWNPARCGADLTRARVMLLEKNSPVLAVQSTITDAIINGHADFGIYQQFPTPLPQVLADLRVLGECFQSDVDRQTLATLVPTELVSEYVDLPGPVRTHRGRMPDRASCAVGTAMGVSAAMAVVGQADIESAAEVLSSIWPRGRKGSLLSRINTVGRRGADSSPALRGACLTALEPQLGVPDQLRCRLGAALPRRPARDVAMAFQMATRIPTMLWPQWSLRLAEPRSFQRFVRPALSVGLLLVGNDIAVQDGIDLLDCPLSSPSVIAALRHLSESWNWADIRQALYRLSDYLRVHGAPINYQRRRQLSFDGLLPQQAWQSICRRTQTRPEGCATARQYLFERLSALTAFPSPLPEDREAQYSSVLRFPIRLTPELGEAMTRYALEFLATHGVRGEPAQWSPPMELLDGLRLPGVGTGTVDTNELHRLVNLWRHGWMSLSAILRRLGITADVFRQACEEHPTPRDPRKPPTPTVTVPRPGPAYQKASSVLTPQRFLDLYETEGRSLSEIGAMVGVCKQTIAELARDYGITIKRNGRGKYAVDPEWLHDQHVNKGRSLSQISRECGVSLPFLAGLAHRYRVPVRKPSRYSATALMANRKVPKTLIPALVTQGGWERLQRLPVIAQYESLAAAERALRAGHVALGLQVSLIERDLGGSVLIRATQHTEQRLTPLGQKVVAAVHTPQARGGPAPTRRTKVRSKRIDDRQHSDRNERVLVEMPRAQPSGRRGSAP